MPGVYNKDYTYPTHEEIDYYASKGLGVIRLPFLWERLQRNQGAELDPDELGHLDDVVNYATSKGLKVEIEPHDYGFGFGALIGSAQTPNSAFADFWGKLPPCQAIIPSFRRVDHENLLLHCTSPEVCR